MNFDEMQVKLQTLDPIFSPPKLDDNYDIHASDESHRTILKRQYRKSNPIWKHIDDPDVEHLYKQDET